MFCSLHTLDYRTMRHVETSKFSFLTRPRRLAKGYIASALGFFSFCAFLIKLVREDISGLLAPGRFRTSHRRVEGLGSPVTVPTVPCPRAPGNPLLARGHSDQAVSRIQADAPGPAGQEMARRFFSSRREERGRWCAGAGLLVRKVQIARFPLGGARDFDALSRRWFSSERARAYFCLYAVYDMCIVYSYLQALPELMCGIMARPLCSLHSSPRCCTSTETFRSLGGLRGQIPLLVPSRRLQVSPEASREAPNATSPRPNATTPSHETHSGKCSRTKIP